MMKSCFFLLCRDVVDMDKMGMYRQLEKKFIILRLFFLLLILPFVLLIKKYQVNFKLLLIISSVTLFYFLLIFYAAYNKRGRISFILKYTIFFDTPIISLFVYLFGGMRSDAYLLYFLIILFDAAKYSYLGTILSLTQSIFYYLVASILINNFDIGVFFVRVLYLNAFSVIIYELNSQVRESNLKEKEAIELAYKDSLTQLPNRLLMSDKFEKMRINYEKTGKSFAISIIDIDNFKMINDSKGHAFGDKVLQKLSNIFLQCLSEDDFICRFGGEEFVVFFADENKDDIYEKANKICEKVKEVDFYGEKVTVSIGVSLFNEKYTMIENISFADEAMYAVKNTGKNKVMLYDDLKFSIKHA